MIRNAKYIRTAHRKAALTQLLRHLMSEYQPAEGAQVARRELVCEDVTFVDRIVTLEALNEVEEYLRQLIEHEDKSLRRFELTEREDLPNPVLPAVKQEEEVNGTQQDVKRKPGRKPRNA